MAKTVALAHAAQSDPLTLAVVRFAMVAGCATALIMARYPLPF